jgi:hypothetical protein
MPPLIRCTIFLVFCICFSPLLTKSQAQGDKEESSVVIEDNSFFVEEAFNQEEGVVQHIFNGLYYRRPQKNMALAFTQEWPLWGRDHQFSYTFRYDFLSGPPVNGIGDLLVNYRYQVWADQAWAAVAPRVSVIVPTGNVERRLGLGVLGWQVNLPISKRLSGKLIAHVNVGLTIFPNVDGTTSVGQSVERTLSWFNIAASMIWLAEDNWNIMLETAGNSYAEIGQDGGVARSTELIVCPAFRYAINLHQLQIVPGLGIPLSIVDGETRGGAFIYLSFEHPF